MEDPLELSLTREELAGVCFLLLGVDKLVMEVLWDCLGVVGLEEATFVSRSSSLGLNSWGGRLMSEM